jgi:hypothetical protein
MDRMGFGQAVTTCQCSTYVPLTCHPGLHRTLHPLPLRLCRQSAECGLHQMHEYAYKCVRMRRDAHCGAEQGQKRERTVCIRMRHNAHCIECVRMRANVCECISFRMHRVDEMHLKMWDVRMHLNATVKECTRFNIHSNTCRCTSSRMQQNASMHNAS